MADVFISYAHEDRAWINQLAASLEKAGLSVWWDPSLLPGRRYRDAIRHELEAAKSVVVVWSRHSVESDWVRDEAEEAKKLQKLIPVIRDAVTPPHGFGQLQTCNLESWPQQPAEMQRLLDALAVLAGKVPAEVKQIRSQVSPWKPLDRRVLAQAGIVAAALLIVTLGYLIFQRSRGEPGQPLRPPPAPASTTATSAATAPAAPAPRDITPSPAPSGSALPSLPRAKAGEHLYGIPIHGGDAFDTAVPLKRGTLYHLDYDQPAERQDFFQVTAKGGQRVLVTITGGNSNSIQAEIINAQRQRVTAQTPAATRNRNTLSYDLAYAGDGVFYVLIESAGYGSHVGPDCTFQIDVLNQFDANSNRDAGDRESSSLGLKPGQFPHNNMNDSDTMDVFKATLLPGKTYTLKVRPASDAAYMNISAVDSDGVILGNSTAADAGAMAKLADLKLPGGGLVYLKVTFVRSYGGPAGNYAMSFGPGDVPSPSKPEP